MRTLVHPPPSLHCDLCHGELRLKQIERVGPLSFELDIEIFVCTKCGHEQRFGVGHNHYAAHTPSKMPTTKVG
jgi:hypothetical protein